MPVLGLFGSAAPRLSRPLSVQPAPRPTFSPDDEEAFQLWYRDKARKNNLDLNPDAPEHHYDYRSAYLAGEEPGADGHWSSQFKAPDHPNRFVDGVDTLTGESLLPDKPAPSAAPGHTMANRGMFSAVTPPQPAPTDAMSNAPAIPKMGMMMRGPEKTKKRDLWGEITSDPLAFLLTGTEGLDKNYAEQQAQAASEVQRERYNAQIEALQRAGYGEDQIVAFMNNPEKWSENASTNIAAANVGAGDSRYVNGKFVTAPRQLMNVANEADVYDPNVGKPVYQNDKAPEDFTLNPGDVRFNGAGKQVARVAPLPAAPGAGSETWRPATQADLPTYNLPDTGYLISSKGDVKQITDSRKSGQVPASMQTMEQRYLDAQDAESSRLLDLANKYTRFNTLAKDWNSQGEGIWNDMGQALSMDTSTLKSITSELIGKMRTPGEGVMTDADAKRLESATVSINQTKEGNQLAERIVGAAAKRAQERALFLRQWMADNGAGSLNKAKLAWNYYAKQFPVYDPQTGEPSDSANTPDAYGWVGQQGFASQGGQPRIPAGPVSNGQPVRVTSKEQMDSLPVGTPFIAPDGSTWTKK